MNIRLLLSLLIIISLSSALFAQDKTVDNELETSFKQHVGYLASDELEGRATGSPGEALAYKYLIKEFEALELEGKGDDNTFLQAFDFLDGKKYGEKNSLSLNGIIFKLEEDYLPLMQSGNGNIAAKTKEAGYGITAPDLNYDDYKALDQLGKEDILWMKLGSPEGDNPHTTYGAFMDIDKKIEMAMEKGAGGIILYPENEKITVPTNDLSKRITAYEIPVVCLTHLGYEKMKSSIKKNQAILASMEVDWIEINKTGHNVLAWLDKGANQTVVIGAHYDHLGYGESGGSLYAGKEPMIHNGADDNASGVAMVVELAKSLKDMPATNNYLFLAFSGEELGLFGSSYFVKNTSIPVDNINYMLNFDMIGRLDNDNLVVNGVGTSPSWNILDSLCTANDLNLKTYESGIGSSDHTSFYLKEIPAIHVFTGAHSDYHKPSDDAELVNYKGLVQIHDFIVTLIENLDDDGELDFTSTKIEEAKVPKFKVGLGVIPDYLFSGQGMRIDGVREGKAASNAGLQIGDIVIQLGDIRVKDMMSYMKALSIFKKEDSTKVTIKREEKELVYDIIFK